MALKGNRISPPYTQRVDFFMDEVQERGKIVCLSVGGSGVALDQGVAVVTVPATSSGAIPMGMLLCDMVNKDLTRTHLNFHKDEVQKGGKVIFNRKGWYVTDQVIGTPSAGNKAYLTSSGQLSATNQGAAATPLVGQFLSSKDEDGYIKVEIDLPNG